MAQRYYWKEKTKEQEQKYLWRWKLIQIQAHVNNKKREELTLELISNHITNTKEWSNEIRQEAALPHRTWNYPEGH